MFGTEDHRHAQLQERRSYLGYAVLAQCVDADPDQLEDAYENWRRDAQRERIARQDADY